ncbi:MAG: GDSL-type esterase/lipase family protein [Bacteroidota bacterium]|nr:GDSL-type esterase/lipase family protein [Bacteroidota bacterium]
MKIKNIVITLFVILLVVFVFSYFFPKEGVTIGGLHVDIPTFEDVFLGKKVEYANIDKLINDIDSTKNTKPKIKTKRERREDFVYIEYPDSNETLLYNFFASLSKSKEQSVRVLHYGDSQIEGDRITSYIRARLQEKFFGNGQGEIPIYSQSNIGNVAYEYSNGWKHHQIISPSKGFHSYGLTMECSETKPSLFTPVWVLFKFYKPINTPLTLYCTALGEKAKVKILANGNLLEERIIEKTPVNKIHIEKIEKLKTLKIETNDNILLYGLDISEDKGVYVDNVSLRGSSGLGFSRGSEQLLSLLASEKYMNVKLIIMQFGTNVIPKGNETIVTDYDYFRKSYSRELAFLRKAMPNVAIIVIGPSDRSIKKGSHYITHPNIPKLIETQRQVAKENGCMFWDLFSAMGGENSMPAWVLRDKPLANTDFIHFNHRGAEYVGELFYKALQEEYLEYKRK